MATISGATNEQVFTIKKWYGLNEAPDGDTHLKLGEASKMVNWRITRDGNLKRRPSLKKVAHIKQSDVSSVKKPVQSMWTGIVGGHQVMLAACDNWIWSLYDDTNNTIRAGGQSAMITNGGILTNKKVGMFPFDGKVYFLNGTNYYEWNGGSTTGSFKEVEGYRPLIAIAISPVIDANANSESGETTGEYVNLLNGKRRVWISPDGVNNVFQLPEKNITSIDYVTDLSTGQASSLTYTASTTTGQISFNSTPDQGVNTLEIGYTKNNSLRSQVTGNLFAELFSGTTDTRIFIYGNGTNRALYSGMDYDGMPRADYFPDQYCVDVGDSNTPITSMIRHYGTLVTYKTNETWNLQHGVVELMTDNLTPAIYSVPVNRDIGNVAPGMVRLVNNNPISAFGHELYQWSNSSYYTSNLSRDERQAKRISDRVQKTLASFDLSKALMYDDNDNQEFYVVYNKKAVVLNYATDTWYTYDNFDAVSMCNLNGELYIGTSDGDIMWLTYTHNGDDTGLTQDPEAIEAEWESGDMDFGAGHMRKYSSMLWVGMKPATGTSVNVCVETDRKNTFRDKIISSTKAKISGEPFMAKAKIKAKKFVYYRLLLSQDEVAPAVTVTDVNIRVRSTGYAK